MIELPEHLRADVLPQTVDELLVDWRWLIGDEKRALMLTASGDVFLADAGGAVHWLETGAGTLTSVATDLDEFQAALREPKNREQWLLEPVILRLRAAGVRLGSGECYGYKILPVLGGDYHGDNRVPMTAKGHLGFTGYLHEKIKDLPDGTQITLKWVDEVAADRERAPSQRAPKKRTWWSRLAGR
jgi:hypothetical protein